MLGMSLASFTIFHVALGLVGIITGLVVVFGMIAGKRLDGLTAIFLITTAATSLTGFGFPFHRVLPSHIVGAISLLILLVAVPSRYVFSMEGAWRRIYVVTAVLALYLNVFVLVVQGFLKLPALHALAPTQTETPFKIAQLAVLIAFMGLGTLSLRGFRAFTEQAAGAGASAAR